MGIGDYVELVEIYSQEVVVGSRGQISRTPQKVCDAFCAIQTTNRKTTEGDTVKDEKILTIDTYDVPSVDTQCYVLWNGNKYAIDAIEHNGDFTMTITCMLWRE